MDQGLPERFQATFRQHYPSVLRQLMLLVGDRMIAEDLAQEVFLRLYRKPPDDLGAVGAWLHRVSTRLAYDFIRQRAQRQRVEDRELVQGFPEASAPPSDLAVMRSYDRDMVKRVLQQLSERDRQALLLRYSGYSYAEIASIIDVSPEIVGTLLRRALGRFKKQFYGMEGVTNEGQSAPEGRFLS